MATFYWRGGTGSFGQPSGWQIADVYGVLSSAVSAPGDADTVVLDTTAITLTADSAFAGLLQLDLPNAAGALNLGGYRLTLLSTAQLGDVGSGITGAGTLETDAITAVPNLDGGGVALLLSGGAVWVNAGLVMDAGVVGFGAAAGDSASLVNQSGALFALATDQIGQLTASAGGSSFSNSGTLAKIGGTGLSSLTVAVTNTGVIEASSGTLELDAGGVLGGIIGGDAGQIRLAGTFALPDGSSSVSFGSGARFGAAADGVAVLRGPGTLASSGSVRLTDWTGAQLLLAGGATWNNGGTVTAAADLAFGTTAGDSGTLVNQAGASFVFAGDANVGTLAPGTYNLVNAGTLSKAGGSGTSRIGVPVTGTGSVSVAAGTLEFDAGGTLSGPLGGNGTLAFGGGTFAITGAGYTAPNTAIAGGTLDLSAAPADFQATLHLSAGVLAFGTQAAVVGGQISQTGGTLSGGGTLTAWGGGQLTGGLQTGAGSTRLLGGSTLGDGAAVDGGRTIQNDAALTWSAGNIVLGGGDASLPVHAGTLSNAGLLRITAAAVIGPAAGGSGVLDNAGVMLVDAGAGETDIDAALVNRGVLQVAIGTLSLNGGGSSAGALLLVNSAAELRFGVPAPGGAGGIFRITGGAYAVADTVVDGGTLDLSGASGFGPGAALSLDHGGGLLLGGLGAAAGLVQLNGGAVLSGTGRLTVSGGAQLGDGVQSGPGATVLLGQSSIDGAMQLDGGRTLENDGTLLWNGGSIVLGGGDAAAAAQTGTLTNAAGALFEIATDGTIALPGAGSVANAGALIRSAGTGAAVIAAELANSGTVTVQSGTLTLGQAVTGSGTFLIEGARLDFAGIVGGGATIRFLGGGGTLAVDTAGAFGAPVAGFAAGDALDLTSVGFTAGLNFGFAAGSGGGTLTVSDGTHSASVSMLGSYAPGGFILGSDGHGGVMVGYS